jgi:hypothetical protein
LKQKLFFECEPCGAYVGTHPDGKPLGRLANAELRKAKQAAHVVFDPLWQNFHQAYPRAEDVPNRALRAVARKRAYAWLAEQMSMEADDCHIGAFDVETCALVREVIARENPTPISIRQWAKKRAIELASARSTLSLHGRTP